MTVNSRDEELALGGGWANSPAAFDVYKNPAKARPQEPNPLKWVDQWPPTLHSSKNQRKIGAILLKAHGEFWKSPEYPSATADCMRQAFDGIARVLFDDGLLSETILLNDVADLVWDSAIAGGWWHLASETQIDIFPHKKSHYWVWFDETRDWPTLFRGAMAEWAAKLLEIEAPDTENGAELPRAGILASNSVPETLSITEGQGSENAQPSDSPEERLQRFVQKHPGTTYADIKFSASVHTPEFQGWRHEKLNPKSVMFARIEEVLSGVKPLKKKPRKRRAE